MGLLSISTKLTLILKGVDRTSNSRSAWGPAGAPLTLKELREDMVALLVYVQVLFKWTETISVYNY